jgi:hypothetical protein
MATKSYSRRRLALGRVAGEGWRPAGGPAARRRRWAEGLTDCVLSAHFRGLSELVENA